MCGLDFPVDDNLLVGLHKADDAGVYRVNDDVALIQTVDFFTPIVDDPYWFGKIAAANALSDVYAMGGVPKTAMNLVGFPLKQMEMIVLRSILEGGLDCLREADTVLVGGHSVEDEELKYGLSVTGFIHPGKILTKQNLKQGDQLVLTKPLGTGIINTAIKANLANDALIETVTRQMARLNRTAAEVMANYPVHACTDITGFGLIGHLVEMVVGSGKGIRLYASHIPVIEGTAGFAKMGIIPAGAHRNREFRDSWVSFHQGVERYLQDIFFDPQTSGGLLISVKEEALQPLLTHLNSEGETETKHIGEVVLEPEEKIQVSV